jgi:hypothetical protein
VEEAEELVYMFCVLSLEILLSSSSSLFGIQSFVTPLEEKSLFWPFIQTYSFDLPVAHSIFHRSNMKFSFGLLAGLAATVLAEDVLFVDVFKYKEYSEAIGTLGLTAKVVTEAQ